MVVDAAIKFMQRIGCEVSEVRDGDRISLEVLVPPDSSDPHGDRLLAAINATG
jgi:hypothetical protein